MKKKQDPPCMPAEILPPVVSLVGKPDSGKTTLLEKLIPELKHQGYKVGTIKHHVHEFEMDKPGKDTWRHKQAGANTVVLSSPTGIGLVRDTKKDSTIEELVARYFHDVDIIITEGYKRAPMPKIEVFRSTAHKTPLEDRDETWVALISDVEMPNEKNIPIFKIDNIPDIASFLIEQFITLAPKQNITLLVNGKSIPLNSFVKNFIKHTVTGMTTSLKGCEKPKKIIITIRND